MRQEKNDARHSFSDWILTKRKNQARLLCGSLLGQSKPSYHDADTPLRNIDVTVQRNTLWCRSSRSRSNGSWYMSTTGSRVALLWLNCGIAKSFADTDSVSLDRAIFRRGQQLTRFRAETEVDTNTVSISIATTL